MWTEDILYFRLLTNYFSHRRLIHFFIYNYVRKCSAIFLLIYNNKFVFNYKPLPFLFSGSYLLYFKTHKHQLLTDYYRRCEVYHWEYVQVSIEGESSNSDSVKTVLIIPKACSNKIMSDHPYIAQTQLLYLRYLIYYICACNNARFFSLV